MIRRRFVKVTNHSTNMSEHVALQAAHVPQTTLCVTSGARCFRTHFRHLCTSWPDLWASTPPRPPIIPKMGTSRHLVVNYPPTDAIRTELWHAFCLTSVRYLLRSRERHAHEVARRHRAGSGDWENPKREGAYNIPGLPVLTGPP